MYNLPRILTFVTLGPAGGNHEFVLQRYLAAHGMTERSTIVFVKNFHDGAEMVIERSVDFMLQCAAHPTAAEITGTYRKKMFVVDAFISRSRPMALMRALDAPAAGVPRRVGLQPATRDYVDLSAWPDVVPEPTVTAVGQGLLQGKYEAGIAFSTLAAAHPERFEVIEPIGSVCDAWVMYGPEAVDGDEAVVWRGSPARRLYDRM